jgi:hypothetical protein
MVYCVTCERHVADIHLILPAPVTYRLVPAFTPEGMIYRQTRFPAGPVDPFPCTIACARCQNEVDIKHQGFRLDLHGGRGGTTTS